MKLDFSEDVRNQARLIQLAIYGLKDLAKSDRKVTLSFLQKEGQDIMTRLDSEISFAVEKLSCLTKHNVESFISGSNIFDKRAL